MMKVLNYEGLTNLVAKLIAQTKKAPQETVYSYPLSINVLFSATIPNYLVGNSLVEVYVNGLRLAETTEYTLDKNGLLTLLIAMHTDNNKLLIIHKKWG